MSERPLRHPANNSSLARRDPWQGLRTLTDARIALGRAGNSQTTDSVLAFGLAHAQARDAVHLSMDMAHLETALATAGFSSLRVQSAASDRAHFLRRPDLGRRLDDASRANLDVARPVRAPDVVFVIADGLSALAVQTHALPLLCSTCQQLPSTWTLGPVVIARQARVALGDEIGERLGARQVVMLIGERPGLSAPDSLGIYLTFAPRPGRTDAERNCISNVRHAGLSYVDAASKLVFLLQGAQALGHSGVHLKEDTNLASEPEPHSLGKSLPEPS